MELYEFITESLTQISGAVQSAQRGSSLIAPEGTRLNVDKQTGVIGPYGKPLYMVEFDVAVTASEMQPISGPFFVYLREWILASNWAGVW